MAIERISEGTWFLTYNPRSSFAILARTDEENVDSETGRVKRRVHVDQHYFLKGGINGHLDTFSVRAEQGEWLYISEEKPIYQGVEKIRGALKEGLEGALPWFNRQVQKGKFKKES